MEKLHVKVEGSCFIYYNAELGDSNRVFNTKHNANDNYQRFLGNSRAISVLDLDLSADVVELEKVSKGKLKLSNQKSFSRDEESATYNKDEIALAGVDERFVESDFESNIAYILGKFITSKFNKIWSVFS